MKIPYFTLFIFLSSFITIETQGQTPWRKRAKIAANFEKSGDLHQAAIYYRSVYQEKPEKLEYSFKAGQCFLELRDYENAVKSLEVVKDENNNPKYNKPGYKYALALKQKGAVNEAKEAFNHFLLDYQGVDKALYQEFVENELKGCNYALKAQQYTNPTVKIEHLDAKINSSKTEFAPIPFTNDVLYFSSTIKGVAKIHRTVKQADGWVRPQIPSIFLGKMERAHFGNGSFTQDGHRFYFTQCDIKDGKPQCAIYLMEDLGDGQWSTPVILPDYINPENANTTHPIVVNSGDHEILYFASNRPGGKGGLDLWYSTRPITGDNKSFTLPKNLGRNINSIGDEISPFYHKATGTLYFSSNGRVSAGGLDIFKSKGQKLQWEVAQNLGFPINSSADDLYYTISEAHGGGYLVSNRPFLPERKTTTDDDIFYFGIENIEINVSGAITDSDYPEKGLLKDLNIKLFKKTTIGDEELIDERMLALGEYQFEGLSPNTSYIIAVEKENFHVTSFPFTTGSKSQNTNYDIELIARTDIVIPPKTDPQAIRHYIMHPRHQSNDNAYQLPVDPIDPNLGIEYEGDTLKIFYEFDAIAGLGDHRKLYYDQYGNPQPYHEPIIPTQQNQKEPSSVPGPYPPSPLAAPNVVYKIQVSAVRKFRADKYEDLKEVGRLSTEEIAGGIKRILVINKKINNENIDGFKRKSDALNALSYVLNNSRFEYAFVIKYVNGERIGEGFRGWDEEEGLETDTKPDGRIPKDVYEGF
ncbi:tetratricopeptide repeat protein [Aureispira anguillae]|uniref:Outer membrane peptidoglycan-associated protein n=1 Tax=Aureispira anguillae TaxID=2864201 RepID=A0A916DVM8_9BACT|nr:outer membrane peptidoglycan-associated protein [Aureispira anguillae]BDS13735.1 outer membrane peptidoglycan-associated protein [Aureispira anguillae]